MRQRAGDRLCCQKGLAQQRSSEEEQTFRQISATKFVFLDWQNSSEAANELFNKIFNEVIHFCHNTEKPAQPPILVRFLRTPDGLQVLPHVYTLMYQLHFCWQSEKCCFEKRNKKRDRDLNKKAEEKRPSRRSRAQFKTHSDMVLLLYAASVKSMEERTETV